MRILVVVGLSLTLAGCLPPEESLGNRMFGPSKAELDAQRAKVDAKDDETCRSYGAKPGTDIYIQCRMAQVQHRDAANAGGDVIVNNSGPAAVPASDAPVLHNILPPTVRCQTMGTQTVCR
jgi:hypothetical protein